MPARRLHVGRLFRPAAELSDSAPKGRTPAIEPRQAPSNPRLGAITIEYALAYFAVFLPLTFAVIYTAELLWIWHSAADFTRSGARYAATHCWQSGADNVLNFMRTNAPAMVDRQQFTDGTAQLAVTYYSRDPDTGTLAEFSCDGDCSTNCVPDTVTVAVRNYEFRYFLTYLGLPPIAMPDFQTSVPIESAGCDPEQGICLP